MKGMKFMFTNGDILIVDRIEKEYVICETTNRSMININFSQLKETPKEGDVLVLVDGKFIVDKELTKNRLKEVEDFMKGMWQE
jgi:uncharacterized protein YqfB (UPF0267 family)